MIYFAGLNPAYLNDTWSLDLSTGTWSQFPQSPSPGNRTDAAACMDPIRNRLLVFGGWDGSSNRNDLWSHSLSPSDNWVEITPSGKVPSPRYGATLVYDPSRDRAVLFGDGTDVWALDLSGKEAWSELHPIGTRPPYRTGHSAIYDAPRDRMVVFGGLTENGIDYAPLNDTWELSFSSPPVWNELSPEGSPPAVRFSHTAVVDPIGDRMIVFGGGRGPYCCPVYYGDVWSLSLGGSPIWTLVSPSGTPPEARASHVAFFVNSISG